MGLPEQPNTQVLRIVCISSEPEWGTECIYFKYWRVFILFTDTALEVYAIWGAAKFFYPGKAVEKGSGAYGGEKYHVKFDDGTQSDVCQYS